MQCGQAFRVPSATSTSAAPMTSTPEPSRSGQVVQAMIDTTMSGQPLVVQPVHADHDQSERLAMLLPLQLMSVAKVSEFPSERHRWNTNEEVAAILVAFSQHANWQVNDVQLRPPSGRMLLYCRKKVRYRRDGYCWKKRKDGKTTREDHMKLKVQGLECIYGCYVHSAILHTFHRRCYWLLQNPNIVLVHYLNVPLNEENKLSVPTLSLCSEKEWTQEELIGQLQPMFASLQKSDPSNINEQLIEETIRSIVSKLMISQQRAPAGRTHHECMCASAPLCNHAGSRIISPKTDASLAKTTSQVINTTQKSVSGQSVVLNLSQLAAGTNNVIILSQHNKAVSVMKPSSTTTTNASLTSLLPSEGNGGFVVGCQKSDSSSRTILKAGVTAQIARHKLSLATDGGDSTTTTTTTAAAVVTSGQAMDTSLSADTANKQPFLPTLTGDLSLDTEPSEFSNKPLDGLKHVDLDYHDLISPSSTDLNLDAFDFLNFPDFIDDSDCQGDVSQQVSEQRTAESHAQLTANDIDKNDVLTPTCDHHSLNVSRSTESKCALVTITDFSPEWSYPEGGCKVLVTGPWYSPTSAYTVLFDGVSLPASLVQSGVLRCFAPAHTPNLVSIEVACDGCVISKSVVFEYKSRETVSSTPKLHGWFSLQEDELKVAIMDKLEELKKRLAPSSPDLDPTLQSLHGCQPTCSRGGVAAFESHLINYCRQLSGRTWCRGDELTRAGCGQRRLTLLHLASALGCARLIAVLIEWRSSNSSPALKYDVDAFSLDENCCSPLMWACALGHTAAAATLYRWHSAAVTITTRHGASPVSVARQHGHVALAHWLESLELLRLQCSAPEWQSVKPPEPPTSARMVDGIGSYQCEQAESTTTTHDPWADGLTIDIPPPPPYPGPPASQRGASLPASLPADNSETSTQRRQMKRFSVDALSDNGSGGYGESHRWQHGADPMISVRDRDVNSPIMFMHGSGDDDIADAHRHGIAMETDGPHSPCCGQLNQQLGAQTGDGNDTGITSQMATLADEIIAGMPMRIKLRPASPEGDTNSTTEVIAAATARDRSSSYGSFSSCSSCPTPPGVHTADDSGISTPLEGIMYEEYRYSELGTPESSLSPASSCLPSPYSFRLADSTSPPPTAAEFTEYFNAPSTYMQKDFSQLMLSDDEQRKLYDAAQLIQSYYRKYRDKKEHLIERELQRERELEAAVLIQSYYRRYKQYVYYKKMTQAAVLIQSQFRGYSAQKRFRLSRDAATLIQNSYRAYRQHEGFKRRRSAAVIIQQRFRSHYQRNRSKQADGVSKCRKRLQQQTEQGLEASGTSTEGPTPSTTDSKSSVVVDSDMKESPR